MYLRYSSFVRPWVQLRSFAYAQYQTSLEPEPGASGQNRESACSVRVRSLKAWAPEVHAAYATRVRSGS